MRKLQEPVKQAFCFKNCTVQISNLKTFANSQPSALHFKSFYRSLEHFFLTVGQNNFGNKITINNNYQTENPNVFEHFKGIPYKIGQYSQAIQVTLKVGDSTQSFWVWKWACSRIHTIRLVFTLEVYYELQDLWLTLESMPLAGLGRELSNIYSTTLDFQSQ